MSGTDAYLFWNCPKSTCPVDTVGSANIVASVNTVAVTVETVAEAVGLCDRTWPLINPIPVEQRMIVSISDEHRGSRRGRSKIKKDENMASV